MNDYDIRIDTDNGSYIWCSLGECTHEEALTHLASETDKWFRNPKRDGAAFTMHLNIASCYA